MALGSQRWLLRQVRGLRPDRNPLRRRSDRVETCLLAALFTAAAVGTPFAAVAASHAAWQGALHTQAEQQATRHQVEAYLSQPAVGGTAGAYALSATVPAHASWKSVHGMRTGIVPAQVGSPKGFQVPIYTDDDGNLTSPPLSNAEVANEANAAGVGAVTAIAVTAFGGAAAIRHLLNRRRMAGWEADWAVTDRKWNRQRW